MTSLTERYLAVALRGIPDRQRPDVERELRSSIDDAVEDRVSGGDQREGAEVAVLEGLGDPRRLAAGMRGRPLYLIGPDMFLQYRRLLLMLLTIVVPIVAVILAAVELGDSGNYVRAIGDGVGGALNVAVHICFWVTLTFALIERADAAREARTQIREDSGRWSVKSLPEVRTGRVSVGDTVGEVLTVLLTLGGLLVVRSWSGFTDENGVVVSTLTPDFANLWLPVVMAALVGMGLMHLTVFRMGRWTMPLASIHALLQVAFAGPLIALALTGSLISPAFAVHVGWPPLAQGNGPVMVWLAVGVLLVTAWEIVDAFRRARRGQGDRVERSPDR